MKIDSSLASNLYKDLAAKFEKKEEDGKALSAKEISTSYLMQYQAQIQVQSFESTREQAETFRLADIGYVGKPIAELSVEEAKELVSEDGFFGVEQTSMRIAEFVLNGAGDDVEMLKAGREGILQGFKEAEELWGGKLPQISYDTIDKAVAMIDEKLSTLDVPIIDTNA